MAHAGEAAEQAAKAAGTNRQYVADAKKLERDRPDLAAKVKRGEVTILRAKQQAKLDLRAAERKQRSAEAARRLPGGKMFNVHHGDFREWKLPGDDSVSLVFADPPYDRKSLGLYGDLAKNAARTLQPGGSLICYAGQYLLQDILPLMTPHLRFWWMSACIHTGQLARMREYGIVVHWKPLLWFVKDTRGDKDTFIEDAVSGDREKDAHPWQQAVVEAEHFIDKLTKPGDLVFDPFCGGGTTAVAAKRLKRNWLTCDVDKESVVLARQRIQEDE